MTRKKNAWISMLLILTVLALTGAVGGCNEKKEKSAQDTKNKDNQKKIPDALKEVETSVESIIKTLDKDDEEEKNEEKITIETKTEIKQEEDSEKAENETKQETKEEIKKENPEEKQWKTVEKQIKKLHEHWNDLQPDIVKAATPKESIDSFSNLLNDLTLYVEAKDMQNTLFLANEVYLMIPSFMGQFDNEVPPDLKRMEYHVRNAKYNGMADQWEQSTEDMAKLKSYWSTVKTQAEKEQEEKLNQIEFSISELERVVAQKNMILTDIKSKLVLDNIKKLEESMNKAGDS